MIHAARKNHVAAATPEPLALAFNLAFDDLYAREGLVKLDRIFLTWLEQRDAELQQRLLIARGALPDAKAQSQLILDLAPAVEDFIAALFNIEDEVAALTLVHKDLEPLYACKRLFVQRRAIKAHKPEEAAAFNGASLRAELEQHLDGFSEENFARQVMQWLEDEEKNKSVLACALQYAAWAMHTPQGRTEHGHGILFQTPKKLDFDRLVPVEEVEIDGVRQLRLNEHHLRHREGFRLTDEGASLKSALDAAHYCIFCHHQGKDSCSKGMREKDGTFKKSPTRVTLNGCPLEEHISEMNELKSTGVPIGAFATIMINNPMAAGTGHRICNDCMKSCIYQKQEPVNIPQVETRTLKDVLSLPWGFEIYSLLTRWNPLNLERPLPKPDTGRKVLVVGLGPAGYTLSHHLMNDGHTIVAVDGLKIEPLPETISGITSTGERVPFRPIHDVNEIYEDLSQRTLAGFGGVAEYGITVRWNKNYLKIIRLLLERRAQFAMFGGVRFGGTLTVNDAWKLGFDHIAMCAGAGKPRVLDIPGGMARGVRTASDFLMALQLTGAAKADSIANLTVRLPIVVIGGGLTGIDATTESLAYYPVQVEKFLTRYETLVAEIGKDAVQQRWNEEDRAIAAEFIAHARAIREEREAAKAEGRAPNLHALLESWGGATMIYRKSLTDAPSYRLNHEEVELAMQEGIRFAPSLIPIRVETDAYGYAGALHVKKDDGTTARLEARTVLVATGTQPNTVIQREDALHFTLDGQYFQALDAHGTPAAPEQVAKPSTPFLLTRKEKDGRGISFFGDLHPSFAGNVVKAMGSARQGYPIISAQLMGNAPAGSESGASFLDKLRRQLVATVVKVERLTPTIIEVVVKAPLAARQFEPGQFYRLQNYERFALKTDDTTLGMEGLALTGAWVDKEQGLLSTIVLEMGGSSDLCIHLKPGEPVILMGPTGTPTDIPENETVLLAGGGLGNAVLFSIGKAMREKGCKVLYFAGYRNPDDRFKIEEIEAASDVVVWCCDNKADFKPNRRQDKTFTGNIVEAMIAYQDGILGPRSIELTEVDRIIAIGSDRMMAAVAAARHNQLAEWLKPAHVAIGSINSPMQCMMKEICAQCLQRHVDPVTGEESYIFSCFNQDQELDKVDFGFLSQRLQQNSVQEKLTAKWIGHCLTKAG